MSEQNQTEPEFDTVEDFSWEPIPFKIYDIDSNDSILEGHHNFWNIFGTRIIANNMMPNWQFQELVEYYVQNRMDRDLHNIRWSVEYAYDIHTKNPIPSSDQDSEIS
jgi:hypothetical protein